MIANTSIKRIVCLEEYSDKDGLNVLGGAGIKLNVMRPVIHTMTPEEARIIIQAEEIRNRYRTW